MFTLTQPRVGRGSFVSGTVIGGTLDVKGLVPGNFYRAPANKNVKMPGSIGALAFKNGLACSVNDWAVHRAIMAYQEVVGADPDGVLGPLSHGAITGYQKAHGLWVDGAIGQKTSKLMFEPLVRKTVQTLKPSQFDLVYKIAMGTMYKESGFDVGTVGIQDSYDTGMAQISRKAHPEMSINACFTPKIAIPFMVRLIISNLEEFNYEEDISILAYNLGKGGARSWNAAGRPRLFRGTDTTAYLADVKKG